jgi:hypothetical protein
MPPLARACAATEAPPTLVDALALAPAAARVLAALGPEDRKNLRLAHTSLRDAVGEATTKLEARFDIAGAVRPPAPARWPRLEELTMRGSQGLDAEALRRSAPRPGAACTR